MAEEFRLVKYDFIGPQMYYIYVLYAIMINYMYVG